MSNCSDRSNARAVSFLGKFQMFAVEMLLCNVSKHMANTATAAAAAAGAPGLKPI